MKCSKLMDILLALAYWPMPEIAIAGAAIATIIIAISAATARTKRMRFILHHLLCRAIPSGSLLLLLVRTYAYTEGLYMGNKYYA